MRFLELVGMEIKSKEYDRCVRKKSLVHRCDFGTERDQVPVKKHRKVVTKNA